MEKGRDETVDFVGRGFIGGVDEFERIPGAKSQAITRRGVRLEVTIHQENRVCRFTFLACLGPQARKQSMKLAQRRRADVVATDVSDQFDAGVQYVCHE